LYLIIILNGVVKVEVKVDDVNYRFYMELEQAFGKFPEYHLKIQLGDFSAELGRQNKFLM
jgi:hypothetical protein